MATEPKKWGVAPGANADCNDIPDTADADSGLASWSALFPQLTALPLSAGGRAPKREDFNGLLRAFGQWAFYFMQGGVPSWEASIAYTAGSFARHNGTTWTALKGSTGVEPAEGEYWHALSNFYTSGSLVSDLLNKVYPVGSIYMSVNNVSPASFLGGTWQAIEQGRMLMAAGSSWQAGTTGGAAYHTLTVAEMPAHDHSATETAAGGHTHEASTGSAGAHAHSGSALEDGAHAHNASTGSAGAHAHSGSTNNAGNHYHTGTTNGAGSHSHTRGSMNITGAFWNLGSAPQGTNGAIYMGGAPTNHNWIDSHVRTTSGDSINFDASRSWTGWTSTNGNHSHSFGTSSAGAHTHSVAIAAAGAHTHAITIGKTGSGAAFSILPPYIAVYMWRRTA